MYLGSVFFRGGLGFLNYDDICVRVVNSYLSSSGLFLIMFMLTCSIIIFLSFDRPWSISKVVFIPCVVGAVTVMCVLLFM